VLKGVLYTDGEPSYLRAATSRSAPAPRAYSMWWPPSKIAGRHLAPYLAQRAGAPRAPELRPDGEAYTVSVNVPSPVGAVTDALDGRAVPSGVTDPTRIADQPGLAPVPDEGRAAYA
jgi:hypothetical protein